MRIKIKGFKVYRDRHGKLRCYHRVTKIAVDLEENPIGSPGFIAKCKEIDAEQKKQENKETLRWLVGEWKSSPAYINLKPATKTFYKWALDYLEPILDEPASLFDRPFIVKLRDKAFAGKGWYFTNVLTTTLNTIFSWSAQRGYITINPATGFKKIPRPTDKQRANRPWEDGERYAFLTDTPVTLARVIGLIMYTGMDPIDAISMRTSQYDGSRFTYKRAKTGIVMTKAAPAALRKLLGACPGEYVCYNGEGKPWIKSSLDTRFKYWRDKLEKAGKIKSGLTMKGLRHTKATILKEIGESDEVIALTLAQNTLEMARHYSRDARKDGLLDAATKKFDREEARRKKVSNQRGKVSNRKRPKSVSR